MCILFFKILKIVILINLYYFHIYINHYYRNNGRYKYLYLFKCLIWENFKVKIYRYLHLLIMLSCNLVVSYPFCKPHVQIQLPSMRSWFYYYSKTCPTSECTKHLCGIYIFTSYKSIKGLGGRVSAKIKIF